MTAALLSLALPLVAGLLLVVLQPRRPGLWVIAVSLGSLLAAAGALHQAMALGPQMLQIGGWTPPWRSAFN